MNNKEISNFIKPRYLNYIDRNRFYICLIFGIAFYFFTLVNLTKNIIPFFVVIFLTYEFFTYSLLRYPKQRNIINTFFLSHQNERLVACISQLIETIYEFFFNLIIFMFSYLSTHIIFKLLTYFFTIIKNF